MTQFPQFKFDGTLLWFVFSDRYLLRLYSKAITKFAHVQIYIRIVNTI